MRISIFKYLIIKYFNFKLDISIHKLISFSIICYVYPSILIFHILLQHQYFIYIMKQNILIHNPNLTQLPLHTQYHKGGIKRATQSVIRFLKLLKQQNTPTKMSKGFAQTKIKTNFCNHVNKQQFIIYKKSNSNNNYKRIKHKSSRKNQNQDSKYFHPQKTNSFLFRRKNQQQMTLPLIKTIIKQNFQSINYISNTQKKQSQLLKTSTKISQRPLIVQNLITTQIGQPQLLKSKIIQKDKKKFERFKTQFLQNHQQKDANRQKIIQTHKSSTLNIYQKTKKTARNRKKKQRGFFQGWENQNSQNQWGVSIVDILTKS